jgi:hypothetical protein
VPTRSRSSPGSTLASCPADARRWVHAVGLPAELATQPNWPPSPTGHPAQLATQPNWPPSPTGHPAELASQPSWIRELLMPSFPRFSASCVA